MNGRATANPVFVCVYLSPILYRPTVLDVLTHMFAVPEKYVKFIGREGLLKIQIQIWGEERLD